MKDKFWIIIISMILLITLILLPFPMDLDHTHINIEYTGEETPEMIIIAFVILIGMIAIAFLVLYLPIPKRFKKKEKGVNQNE